MSPGQPIQLDVPDRMAIDDARKLVGDAVWEPYGTTCPCCGQHAQCYRWTLYSTAAQALILYYRLGGTTAFVHTRQLKALGHHGQGDASRLKHWHLLERETDLREDGGKQGRWRVTTEGEQFILGQREVRKYVWLYNNQVQDYDGPYVSIRECLGTAFSYDELMKGDSNEHTIPAQRQGQPDPAPAGLPTV